MRVTTLIATAALVAPIMLPSARASESPTWNLVTENDSYLPTSDKHYTNGLLLSWISAPDDSWLSGFVDTVGTDKLIARHGYFLGHGIFTPSDISTKIPDPNDRPYAGWLYGGVNLFEETDDTLNHLSVMVGLVGPAAGGEFVQNQWHKMFHWLVGGGQAAGWRYQLRNEPGLVVLERRQWRHVFGPSSEFALVPEAVAAVGNVFTYVGGGTMLEFGRHLRSDWGPPRMAPGFAGTDFLNHDALNPDEFGWYFFSGIEGRAMVRNIFLDGNSFQTSRHVDKEILVGDLVFGAAATNRLGRIAVSATLRSKEFKSQRDGDCFLTVSLSF